MKSRTVVALAASLGMLSRVATGQEGTGPQSINLASALKLAGARSVDVELARERLNEARAQEGSTRARYFPWVSPSFTFRRHDGTIQDVVGNILETGKYSYAPAVGLMAQLDLGDTIYQSRSAKENSAAADFGLASNVQDAVLRAAGAYFDLAAEQSLVEVARESLRVAAEYDDELRQAVEIGIATEVEAIRARVQRQRSELLLEQALERRRLASIRLATAVRLDPAIELVAADAALTAVTLVSEASLPELVKQALEANPELKQGRSLVDAAEALKQGASHGPLIPTLAAQVSLGGLGGARSGVADRFGGAQDYAATLYWRVGPGGLFDKNRKALADAKVQIANLGLEGKRQDVERQVAEAYARVTSLAQQIRITEKAMALAEDGWKLSRERKDFAVGGVLETLQAEQELTRARTDYLRAVADQNKAQYALARTLGRLAPESPAKP
jgi:outer membrane protein TolC